MLVPANSAVKRESRSPLGLLLRGVLSSAPPDSARRCHSTTPRGRSCRARLSLVVLMAANLPDPLLYRLSSTSYSGRADAAIPLKHTPISHRLHLHHFARVFKFQLVPRAHPSLRRISRGTVIRPLLVNFACLFMLFARLFTPALPFPTLSNPSLLPCSPRVSVSGSLFSAFNFSTSSFQPLPLLHLTSLRPYLITSSPLTPITI
jgi:hypothetical protein